MAVFSGSSSLECRRVLPRSGKSVNSDFLFSNFSKLETCAREMRLSIAQLRKQAQTISCESVFAVDALSYCWSASITVLLFYQYSASSFSIIIVETFSSNRKISTSNEMVRLALVAAKNGSVVYIYCANHRNMYITLFNELFSSI
jgi:hypothetical protein